MTGVAKRGPEPHEAQPIVTSPGFVSYHQSGQLLYAIIFFISKRLLCEKMKADSRGVSYSKSLLDWLFPASFALLVSATIRFHSLSPAATMPRMVGSLLALAAVALLTLTAFGRRIAPPRDRVSLALALALATAAMVSVLGSGGIDISLLRLGLYVAMVLLAVVFYLTYRDAGHVPLAGYFLAIGLVHLPFLLAAVFWVKSLTPPLSQYGPRLADFAHVRQFGEFAFFAAVSSTALGVVSGDWPCPHCCSHSPRYSVSYSPVVVALYCHGSCSWRCCAAGAPLVCGPRCTGWPSWY